MLKGTLQTVRIEERIVKTSIACTPLDSIFLAEVFAISKSLEIEAEKSAFKLNIIKAS